MIKKNMLLHLTQGLEIFIVVYQAMWLLHNLTKLSHQNKMNST